MRWGRDEMKQNQFSDEQIVGILQEAEKGERTISALCAEKSITETTFYRRRNRFTCESRSRTCEPGWGEGANP